MSDDASLVNQLRSALADEAGLSSLEQVLVSAAISRLLVLIIKRRMVADDVESVPADSPCLGLLRELASGANGTEFDARCLASDLHPSLGARAAAYIRAHHSSRCSVDDIARAVGVSIRGLSTAFRAYAGCTVLEYRRLVRVSHALSLLRDTDHKLPAIASMCGAGSALSLIRQVTKVTGRTPRTLRRDTLALETARARLMESVAASSRQN